MSFVYCKHISWQNIDMNYTAPKAKSINQKVIDSVRMPCPCRARAK